MERRYINPWSWQDAFGFVQANDVIGAGRVLVCAGQTSVDAEGRPVHAGDMRMQVAQSLDNLETVLRDAGMKLGDVVRLNWYTTDVDCFLGAADVLTGRLDAADCRPASTLLGVARLAFPELLVEFEATAMA